LNDACAFAGSKRSVKGGERTGDLVYQLEGITQREERPWLVRRKVMDAKGNRENLLRMIALKGRLPDLIILSYLHTTYVLLPRSQVCLPQAANESARPSDFFLTDSIPRA
jgi:hypothetical protein